jgi:hypothetical protein
LTNTGVLQVNVQTLTLADEFASICSHVNDLRLTSFLDGLVDSLDVFRNSGSLLNGHIMGNEHVLHLAAPALEVNKFTKGP